VPKGPYGLRARECGAFGGFHNHSIERLYTIKFGTLTFINDSEATKGVAGWFLKPSEVIKLLRRL
jgi:hypothetical protein